MQNKNRIRQYRVTRHVTEEDDQGIPQFRVYGEPYVVGATSVSSDDIEILPLSIFPTMPIGSKAGAIPPIDQIVLGYESDSQRVVHSLGYVVGVTSQLPLSEKRMEAGEYRMRFAGLDSTEFSMKSGHITHSVGLGVTQELNFATRGYYLISDNYKQQFSGGARLSRRYKGRDDFTTTKEYYTKYKESPNNSDIAKHPEVPNLLATSDYVDKVIIQKGGIFNTDSESKTLTPADHVYQLDTLQHLDASGVFTQKDMYTSLKIGAIREGDRKGTILDWSYKKVNAGAATYDRMLSLRGNLTNGTVYLEQHVMADQNPVPTPTDPLMEGVGYVPISLVVKDIPTYPGTFWWAKSINTGADSYFLRETVGKALNLVNYTEVSETSYYLHNNIKQTDGTQEQEFKKELKKDSYTVELDFGEDIKYSLDFKESGIKIRLKTKDEEHFIEFKDKGTTLALNMENENYLMKFKDSKIEVGLDTGDAATSPKVTLSKADGVVITPGTGDKAASIVIASNSGSKHKLVTESWVTAVFDRHMHATAAQGPPSKPISFPALSDAGATSQLTYVTDVQ